MLQPDSIYVVVSYGKLRLIDTNDYSCYVIMIQQHRQVIKCLAIHTTHSKTY
jgi:hypothetical protein